MALIEAYTAQAGQSKASWDYFMAKRLPRSGPKPDDLFLIHCHINQVREFFDARGDKTSRALLVQLEEECSCVSATASSRLQDGRQIDSPG